MKRPPLFGPRLPRWHEWLVYTATGLLFASGLAWLLLDRFGKAQGEFGEEPNRLLPWLLLIHGTLAYAFTILAAMLVPVHMRLGWSSGKNRTSGVLLISVGLFLVVTGIGLYYSTAEQVRSFVDLAHWLVGISLPILLAIHWMRGSAVRRTRGK